MKTDTPACWEGGACRMSLLFGLKLTGACLMLLLFFVFVE